MKNNEEVVNNLFNVLSGYKRVDRKLLAYLDRVMPGRFYPERQVLFKKGTIVFDAFFVSDGYIACYSLNRFGDRSLVSLYGKNSIVAGRSFTEQSASLYEWVVLADSYLLTVSHFHMRHVYEQFPEAGELARIIMAEMTEKEQERIRALRRPAADVVGDFYAAHPGMRKPGYVLPDADVAEYLGIGESTLRRERTKLFNEG